MWLRNLMAIFEDPQTDRALPMWQTKAKGHRAVPWQLVVVETQGLPLLWFWSSSNRRSQRRRRGGADPQACTGCERLSKSRGAILLA